VHFISVENLPHKLKTETAIFSQDETPLSSSELSAIATISHLPLLIFQFSMLHNSPHLKDLDYCIWNNEAR
jgi:hypothetical protein